MSDFLRFLLLGLGSGGIYALLGLGIVLVYRGSGVVNFAHGAFALVGGAMYYELRNHGALVAAIAGVASATLVALLVQFILMGPMRRSSPLARVIATLGVMSFLEAAAERRYGVITRSLTGLLPSGPVSFTDRIIVGADRIWIVGVSVVLTVGMSIVYKRTLFGLATTAVAENERATAVLGWSPGLVGLVNWAAGGAIAGLAGVLVVPIVGVSPIGLTILVVPALSAALIGGFSSFTLTLLGGLLIGALESEATYFQVKNKTIFGFISTTGFSTAVPFAVIIAIMVVRGKALPLRSHMADRLPKLGTARPRPFLIASAITLSIVSVYVFTNSWTDSLTTSAIFGIIVLSLVVVTGYAGQLSLAQFALAGVGAFVSSRMADVWGIPFPLAIVAGVVLTIPIGILTALPAVRARGVNLAVATLGLSVVIASVLLSNPKYTGGSTTGTVVDTPKVIGIDVGSINHPERYAIVSIVLFVLAALMVSNLRRSATGRRLIAVRDNERAAASVGVSVIAVKLYAFGVSAGVAALGGGLIAFRYPHVQFDQFNVSNSIQTVLQGVIGGIGFIGGGVLGGLNTVGGTAQQLIGHIWDLEGWFLFIAAGLLLVVVATHPDGLSAKNVEFFHMIRGKLIKHPAPTAGASSAVVERPTPKRVTPILLEIEDLTVRFGTVVAVDALTLRVAPGEVVGLIGPNGAGKTTLVDAATGFIRNYRGTVRVGGESVDGLNVRGRARVGLTRSFQSLELFDDLTVGDNLRAASEAHGLKEYLLDLVRPGRSVLSEAAIAAIDEFELHDVLDTMPGDLPYAKRRAVAIARAVAASPSILFLDEPAAGLDDWGTRELATFVRRLADEWGMSILLIEHDVAMVMSTCDRVVAINFGRELATGTPAEVRANEAVITSYLGVGREGDANDRDVPAEGDRKVALEGSGTFS